MIFPPFFLENSSLWNHRKDLSDPGDLHDASERLDFTATADLSGGGGGAGGLFVWEKNGFCKSFFLGKRGIFGKKWEVFWGFGEFCWEKLGKKRRDGVWRLKGSRFFLGSKTNIFFSFFVFFGVIKS